MKKIIYPDAHEELAKSAALITLIEGDRHIKNAASSAITRRMLDECKPDKDHFLLHVIGLGDYEIFGSNSNADAFSKSANVKYHNTFVKNGAYYHEHRHHDYRKDSIGEIKMSVHNDTMSRVELAVWGRIRPREGFDKTAEEQYQKLRDGKKLSVSMSCRVPEDRCNCCNHRAPSTAEYCVHMKNTPGQYIPELQKFAFVFNDDPTFFDISDVKRPADRTARQIEAVFSKAASSDRRVPYSAELAALEGVDVPDCTPAFATDLRKRALLERIVDLQQHEKLRMLPSALREFNTVAVKRAFVERTTQAQVDSLAKERPEDLFRKLASNAVVLPLDAFMALFDGTGRHIDTIRKSADYKEAKKKLKDDEGIAQELQEDGVAAVEPLFSCGHAAISGPEDVDQVIQDLSSMFSLQPECVSSRVITITSIRGGDEDIDEDSSEKEAGEAARLDPHLMAKTYMTYKVAALDDIRLYHGSGLLDSYGLMLALGCR